MKKILSIMLVLCMAVMSVTAFAATKTEVTVEIGEGLYNLPMMEDDDNKQAFDMIKEVLDIASVSYLAQDGQYTVAFNMGDADVYITCAQEGEQMYVKSDLLGDDTAAFTGKELQSLFLTIIDIMEENEILDSAAAKELRQQASALDTEFSWEESDSVQADAALEPFITNVAAFIGEHSTQQDAGAQTMDHDAAAKLTTVTLTPAQMREFADIAANDPVIGEIIKTLYFDVIDDDGKTTRFTTENIEQMFAADTVIKIWSDEKDELVALDAQTQLDLQDDDGKVDISAVSKRLTTSQGIGYSTLITIDPEVLEETYEIEYSKLVKDEKTSSGYISVGIHGEPYLAALNFVKSEADDLPSIRADTLVHPGQMNADELQQYGNEKLTGLQSLAMELLFALPEDVLMALISQ